LPLIPEELKIRTHYEGLDIAGSKRVFYLQFLLPEIELADHDEALKKLIIEQEATAR
jgi:tRNA (guanine-N7-)-methyltransferase